MRESLGDRPDGDGLGVGLEAGVDRPRRVGGIGRDIAEVTNRRGGVVVDPDQVPIGAAGDLDVVTVDVDDLTRTRGVQVERAR